MSVGRVYLRSEARSFVEKGYLTLYSKWIEKVEDVERGDYVEIYLGREIVGYGFYEGVGAVGVRILSREHSNLEEAIRENLEEAYRFKPKIMPWNSYRLINADGDLLPGLIIDVYNDLIVIQSTSIGFDKNLNHVIEWLIENYEPRMIFLRNDQRSRIEAGLPIERKPVYGGGRPETIIDEGDCRFLVNVEKGQKTGFFLDQRVNRLKFGELIWADAEVLDLYSYTGAFAIHALVNGASKAVLVEESPIAVDYAKTNLDLNSVDDRAVIFNVRVEEFLRKDKSSYDVIIVDPPALIPSLEVKDEGLRVYRRLYRDVVKKVKHGGLLVASSCSYFLSLDELLEILREASTTLKREVKIVWIHGASPDHTSRPQDSFLRYLKVVFCIVE